MVISSVQLNNIFILLIFNLLFTILYITNKFIVSMMIFNWYNSHLSLNINDLEGVRYRDLGNRYLSHTQENVGFLNFPKSLKSSKVSHASLLKSSSIFIKSNFKVTLILFIFFPSHQTVTGVSHKIAGKALCLLRNEGNYT